MENVHVAGIDGCPDGWIAAIGGTPGTVRYERVERIEELLDRDLAPVCLAVDMPVGLPARSGPGGRTPERLVRPLLGARQSSVFSIPSRDAIYAGVDPALPEDERYRRACAIARETSAEGKAVARQSFHIFPKIVEIDRLLHTRPELAARIHECHPEVSFWAMNGKTPLDEPKKVKGRPYPPGLALRRRLLAAHGFDTGLLTEDNARRMRAEQDDLIDATAAAWTAMRIVYGEALSFPDPPENDQFGLPVAIKA